MDELDRLDGPEEPDGPDDRDLELVTRLRDEPAPDDAATARHHRQLVAAIRAAGAAAGPSTNGSAPTPRGTATDPGDGAGHVARPAVAVGAATGDPDDRGTGAAVGDDRDGETDAAVVELAPAPAGRCRRPRRRLLAIAAALVAIAGALLVLTRIAPDRHDQTVAGPSPKRSSEPPCGPELPFTFPVPAGFEGPFPGSSGEASDPYGPTDALAVHWRNGEATIDVRWPGSLPTDPTTPTPAGVTDRTPFPSEPTRGGRHSLLETFSTSAIGTRECSGLDVNVTSPDTAANEAILDQVEIALLGPGGPLVTGRPLVIGTATADTLPTVDEPSTCPGTPGGPVEGAPNAPSPREALGSYVATNTTVPLDGYEEVALSDGSYGYAYHPVPDDPEVTTVVIHVLPGTDGWRVASWASTRC